MSRQAIPIAWIRELAEPYLRGYRPREQASGSLRGYWFLPFGQEPTTDSNLRAGRKPVELGFFVGYLMRCASFEFLNPLPPESMVFAFVSPPSGAAHRRLVRRPGSLLRKTFDYIRWLTHRPPRFEFYDGQLMAMVRHTSMQDWPRAKYQHFSRNFFIETLAWLVRSGLVRRLAAEGVRAPGITR